MSNSRSEERLAALGAAFRERLAKDAARLEQLAVELDAAATDAEVSRVSGEMRTLAHKLAGTAPAFDADDIGARARALELAAMELSGGDAERRATLKAALRALLELTAAATGTHGAPREFRPRL